MKKILTLAIVLCSVMSVRTAYGYEMPKQTKAEQIMDTISIKAQDTAEDAADSVKSGAKKTGNFIKEKSIIVGEKTAKHAKSGAKKAKNATIKGANKVGNVTAKGLKKAGEKMQSSAENTIERTDKALSESSKKCECNCNCGENCKCNETEKEIQE